MVNGKLIAISEFSSEQSLSVYRALGGLVSYINEDDFLSNECNSSSSNPSKEREILMFPIMDEAYSSKNVAGTKIQLKY